MPAQAQGRWTWDEYLAHERKAETKSEFLDGEIFAMSGASRKHNLAAWNIVSALAPQIKKRGCEGYAGDINLRRIPMRSKPCLLLAALLLLCAAAVQADSDSDSDSDGTVRKSVKLDTGVKLRYTVAGPRDGLPIIFLHGITDSSHSWSSTSPFLADDYRTYALDQRGHGDSEKPVYGYSMAQFAEDAIAFMNKLGIDQAVIVGHSMGSFIAHQVASVYPQRVSHLVLVGSAPTSVRNEVITFLWDEIIGLPDFQDPIDPDFIREFQTGPNPVDPVFFEKVLEESAKLPARVWKAAFRGLATDDHGDFLDDVTAPVLIIWGTLDPIFPLADQQALQAVLPGAVFLAYDGAGHNTQWEQPQRVADDIRAFIE